MANLKRTWIWKGIKVLDYFFPDNQYYKEFTNKKGVCLHHMASDGTTVAGDIDWWQSNVERVATCVSIQYNGDISTMFDSRFWAHALGIKIKIFDFFGISRIYKTKSNGKRYVANNEILNQEFIQVEIDSWGRLTKRNGKYYTWTNKEISNDRVQYYPEGFRGSKYFEKYTDKQIESLRLLLLHWKEEYSLDLRYKGDIMFKVNKRALSGESGLWGHCSFREDKDDVHPQPELINMLKTI